MTLDTLRDLRSDAKNWWYHSQLREQGNVEEARKLERQSIRRAVQALRNGLCHVNTQYGGVILFEKPVVHEHGSTTSHQTTHPGLARAAQRLLPEVEGMMEAFKMQDELSGRR